jgi:hypothetical protein
MLPALRELPPGYRQLLPGKLAGVFDVRLQQWRHVSYVPDPEQNEKAVVRSLLAEVEPGTLILADMGYFAFQWFDELTDRGSRLPKGTSYEVLHTYYDDGEVFDGIIWLGAYRADKAAHAVRLVTFRRGQQEHRYITNVREPATLSLYEIVNLYARRWDIELAVKTVKRHLKLHLLWSSKTVVILQQVWAVLIIAQILQALQMEIAGKHASTPTMSPWRCWSSTYRYGFEMAKTRSGLLWNMEQGPASSDPRRGYEFEHRNSIWRS